MEEPKQEKPSDIDINFHELIGSRIKIFNGTSDSYWGTGEVIDYMDETIFLSNVEIWNGKRKSNADIHKNFVTRIEIIIE